MDAAKAEFERLFCERTIARLSDYSVARLEELVAGEAPDGEGDARSFAELKSDPGTLGPETLLREIDKLGRVRAMGLPANLFADASEKLVVSWRARAARE